MGKSQSSGRRRPAANSTRDWALTPDDIIDAALGMLDEQGAKAFSMRQLATRLDVTVPAIYWHFQGADDLMQHVVRRIFGLFDTRTVDGEPWPDAIRRILQSVWHAARRHPALFDLQQSQPIPTSAGPGQPLLHSLIIVLRQAGFGPDHAVDRARSALWLTLGMIRGAQAAIRRLGLADTGDGVKVELDATAPDADDPAADEVVARLRALDIDELFDVSLELVIDGLRAQLDRPESPPPPSP